MKKLFALLLAAIMVIGMAACDVAPADPTTTAPKGNNDPATTTTAAPTTTEKALNDLPFVEPGSVTITIGIRSNATVLDYDDNKTTLFLEEQTGLDLDFVFFSSDGNEANQQLNLMIAGNEKLPDILFGLITSNGTAKQLGADGYLADISGLFDTHSYWTKAHMDVMAPASMAKIWASVTNEDGSVYMFPTYSLTEGLDQSEFLISLNKVMLNKLNMKAEEIDTVAEVYEFLKKAKEEDGNGNGKDDEIGFVIRGQSAYRGNGLLWVINAYVYCNDTYLWNVTDGKLWSPYTTEEYREAIIELSKWYKEGLISPLCFSISSDAEAKALMHNPDQNICTIVGGHPTLVMNAKGTTSMDMDDMYAAPVILKDESGKGLGGYGVLRDPDNILTQVCFSADSENLELAFRLVDFMNDETALHTMRYGELGVNWEYIDGAALGLTDNKGRPAGRRILKDEWSQETKATWHQNCMYFTGTGAYEAGLRGGGTPVDTSVGTDNHLKYGIRWAWDENLPKEVVLGLIYDAEEQEIADLYKSSLLSYIRSSRAQFITGVRNASDDADWQKFLDELKLKGHDDLLDAAQSAYTRMNG